MRAETEREMVMNDVAQGRREGEGGSKRAYDQEQKCNAGRFVQSRQAEKEAAFYPGFCNVAAAEMATGSMN